MRVRIFQSALTDVKYVFGRPITLQEYLNLSAKDRKEAHMACRN